MTAVTQPGLDRGGENQGAGHRDWDERLARRTHALGGSEITAILSLAGATQVITFAGGCPESATFQTATLADIAARPRPGGTPDPPPFQTPPLAYTPPRLIADEREVALQYSATEGLAGIRDYV